MLSTKLSNKIYNSTSAPSTSLGPKHYNQYVLATYNPKKYQTTTPTISPVPSVDNKLVGSVTINQIGHQNGYMIVLAPHTPKLAHIFATYDNTSAKGFIGFLDYSEDISRTSEYGRVSSAYIEAFSATIPAGFMALNGVASAVWNPNTWDLNTLSQGNIAQAKGTDANVRLGVKGEVGCRVFKGITENTAFIPVTPDYYSDVNVPLATLPLTTTDVGTNQTIWSLSTSPYTGQNLTGLIRITGSITIANKSTATPQIILPDGFTVSIYQGMDNLGNYQLVLKDSQIFSGNGFTQTSVSGYYKQTYLIDYYGYSDTLIGEITIKFNNSNGSWTTTSSNLVLTTSASKGSGFDNSSIILLSQITQGQGVTINSVVNWELLPKQDLATALSPKFPLPKSPIEITSTTSMVATLDQNGFGFVYARDEIQYVEAFVENTAGFHQLENGLASWGAVGKYLAPVILDSAKNVGKKLGNWVCKEYFSEGHACKHCNSKKEIEMPYFNPTHLIGLGDVGAKDDTGKASSRKYLEKTSQHISHPMTTEERFERNTRKKADQMVKDGQIYPFGKIATVEELASDFVGTIGAVLPTYKFVKLIVEACMFQVQCIWSKVITEEQIIKLYEWLISITKDYPKLQPTLESMHQHIEHDLTEVPLFFAEVVTLADAIDVFDFFVYLQSCFSNYIHNPNAKFKNGKCRCQICKCREVFSYETSNPIPHALARSTSMATKLKHFMSAMHETVGMSCKTRKDVEAFLDKYPVSIDLIDQIESSFAPQEDEVEKAVNEVVVGKNSKKNKKKREKAKLQRQMKREQENQDAELKGDAELQQERVELVGELKAMNQRKEVGLEDKEESKGELPSGKAAGNPDPSYVMNFIRLANTFGDVDLVAELHSLTQKGLWTDAAELVDLATRTKYCYTNSSEFGLNQTLTKRIPMPQPKVSSTFQNLRGSIAQPHSDCSEKPEILTLLSFDTKEDTKSSGHAMNALNSRANNFFSKFQAPKIVEDPSSKKKSEEEAELERLAKQKLNAYKSNFYDLLPSFIKGVDTRFSEKAQARQIGTRLSCANGAVMFPYVYENDNKSALATICFTDAPIDRMPLSYEKVTVYGLNNIEYKMHGVVEPLRGARENAIKVHFAKAGLDEAGYDDFLSILSLIDWNTDDLFVTVLAPRKIEGPSMHAAVAYYCLGGFDFACLTGQVGINNVMAGPDIGAAGGYDVKAKMAANMPIVFCCSSDEIEATAQAIAEGFPKVANPLQEMCIGVQELSGCSKARVWIATNYTQMISMADKSVLMFAKGHNLYNSGNEVYYPRPAPESFKSVQDTNIWVNESMPLMKAITRLYIDKNYPSIKGEAGIANLVEKFTREPLLPFGIFEGAPFVVKDVENFIDRYTPKNTDEIKLELKKFKDAAVAPFNSLTNWNRLVNAVKSAGKFDEFYELITMSMAKETLFEDMTARIKAIEKMVAPDKQTKLMDAFKALELKVNTFVNSAPAETQVIRDRKRSKEKMNLKGTTKLKEKVDAVSGVKKNMNAEYNARIDALL